MLLEGANREGVTECMREDALGRQACPEPDVLDDAPDNSIVSTAERVCLRSMGTA
jgi:hypothetical protein